MKRYITEYNTEIKTLIEKIPKRVVIIDRIYMLCMICVLLLGACNITYKPKIEGRATILLEVSTLNVAKYCDSSSINENLLSYLKINKGLKKKYAIFEASLASGDFISEGNKAMVDISFLNEQQPQIFGHVHCFCMKATSKNIRLLVELDDSTALNQPDIINQEVVLTEGVVYGVRENLIDYFYRTNISQFIGFLDTFRKK